MLQRREWIGDHLLELRKNQKQMVNFSLPPKNRMLASYRCIHHEIYAIGYWYIFTDEKRSEIIQCYNMEDSAWKKIIPQHVPLQEQVTSQVLLVDTRSSYHESIRYHKYWIDEHDKTLTYYKNQGLKLAVLDMNDPGSVLVNQKYSEAMKFLTVIENRHKLPHDNMKREIALAIAMGTHTRLGHKSTFTCLRNNMDIMLMIVSLVF